MPIFEPSDDNPYTARWLARVEANLGRSLPDDYKAFVLQNGDVAFGEDGVTFDVTWMRADGRLMSPDESADFENDFMILVLSGPEEIEDTMNVLYGAYSDSGIPGVPRREHMPPATIPGSRVRPLVSGVSRTASPVSSRLCVRTHDFGRARDPVRMKR